MSKIWLVTGSGNGLGRDIAEVALAAGHRVVATGRKRPQLDELVHRYGDSVLPFELDVTNEAQGIAAVDAAVQRFGRLDVVVNNAGYADNGAFEQIRSEDFRRVVETCLFGVVNLTRAALPVMRRQRAGHIIQISSIGGRIALPGNAAYHASKWAVGGFTESIAKEVEGLGVHLTCLEPGGMRTNWGKRAYSEQPTRPALLPDYESTVGASRKQLEAYWGNEDGDPLRVARVVLMVADASALPPHIILGSSALHFVRQVEQERMAEADRWQGVTTSVDVGAQGDIPALPSGRRGEAAAG